ncbi:hypothetical protein [Vacuolonema iberomarrocanum]
MMASLTQWVSYTRSQLDRVLGYVDHSDQWLERAIAHRNLATCKLIMP